VRARVLALAGVLAPAVLLAADHEEHAQKWLGLPVELWKAINLIILLVLLVKFLGKPLKNFFGGRRAELNARLDKAGKDRDEAVRVAAEMQTRLSGLELALSEVRARGSVEGEAEKQAHLLAAENETAALVAEAGAEIERRLARAKAELARAAADLATERAQTLVQSNLTEEDRRRLLEESMAKIGVLR
jgi:F-type H+-transporting ATPase subunit b